MPALRIPRWESFAHAIFAGVTRGTTYAQAYSSVGYTAHKPSAKVNACRLLKSAPEIIARIQELQAEVAKRKRVTVETIVDELEGARVIAEKNEQAGAIVQASLGKARVLGLEAPTKSEVGPAGAFDYGNAQSIDDLCRSYLLNHTDIPAEAVTPEMLEMGPARTRPSGRSPRSHCQPKHRSRSSGFSAPQSRRDQRVLQTLIAHDRGTRTSLQRADAFPFNLHHCRIGDSERAYYQFSSLWDAARALHKGIDGRI
jgi:phage terminase small subunit